MDTVFFELSLYQKTLLTSYYLEYYLNIKIKIQKKDTLYFFLFPTKKDTALFPANKYKYLYKSQFLPTYKKKLTVTAVRVKKLLNLFNRHCLLTYLLTY